MHSLSCQRRLVTAKSVHAWFEEFPMTHELNGDPWLSLAGQTVRPDAPADRLAVQTIEGIEPLDLQLGVTLKKTVPDALYDALFQQPAPTEADIAAAGGDPAGVPLMQTYAIVDAGKVFGLTAALESSDLEHRCLFVGEAYKDLQDVAPWLVELKDGSAFTRNLFTKGEAPWHMWSAAPGIYLRTRQPFDAVWKHLRHFTRLQDEAGNWIFFRFWEPSAANAYFKAVSSDQTRYAPWFRLNAHQWIDTYLVPDPCADSLTMFRADRLVGNTAAPVRLHAPDYQVLRQERIDRDLTEMVTLMRRVFPALRRDLSDIDFDRCIRRSASRAQEFNIRQRAHVFRFAAWDLHAARAFELTDPENRLRGILESSTGETDKMRRLAERMTALDKGA